MSHFFSELFSWIFILIIAAGFLFWIYAINENKQDAWRKYQEALSGTDMREAKDLGRAAYSAARMDFLGRGGGYVTPIDEQAILNDLSAMNVPKNVIVDIPNTVSVSLEPSNPWSKKQSLASNAESIDPTGNHDILESLERLYKLKEIGAITESEYDKQKQNLLR